MLDQAPKAFTASTGRALVALERLPERPNADDRPRAEFVAQLIACEHRFPAYRIARRVAPSEAVAGYDGYRRTVSAGTFDVLA